MSDITELLERLKKVDKETAVWILRLKSVKSAGSMVVLDRDAMDLIDSDIIAGCIQRAITGRHWWSYKMGHNRANGRSWAIVDGDGHPGKRFFADTPAAALLAAYVEALEAMG